MKWLLILLLDKIYRMINYVIKVADDYMITEKIEELVIIKLF